MRITLMPGSCGTHLDPPLAEMGNVKAIQQLGAQACAGLGGLLLLAALC